MAKRASQPTPRLPFLIPFVTVYYSKDPPAPNANDSLIVPSVRMPVVILVARWGN